jgi:hypothetical protein
MFNEISKSQRTMLETAAARQDRLVELPTNLKGGAANKVVAKLIGAGWIKEVKALKGAPVWRKDAAVGAFALKLTAAGMKTIAAAGDDRTAAKTVVESAAVEKTAPAEPKRDARRLGAGAKSHASEIRVSNDRPQLGGVSPAVRAPREGSKLDRLLAMLSSASGATIAELIAATDWLPHTTRAALTGLRKRGYELGLSRGERDSASVYRVIASGNEGKQ